MDNLYHNIPGEVVKYRIFPYCSLEELYRLYMDKVPGSVALLRQRLDHADLQELYRLYKDNPSAIWALKERLDKLPLAETVWLMEEHDDPSLFQYFPSLLGPPIPEPWVDIGSLNPYKMPSKADRLTLRILWWAIQEGWINIARFLANYYGMNVLLHVYANAERPVIPIEDIILHSPKLIQQAKDEDIYAEVLVEIYSSESDYESSWKRFVKAMGCLPPNAFWQLAKYRGEETQGDSQEELYLWTVDNGYWHSCQDDSDDNQH